MAQVIYTTKYPTRYVAFDNPRALVIQQKVEHRGGYELAVFRAPIQNSEYPHLTDGTYIEMVSYQGKQIMVTYHFTAPNKGRQQYNWHKMFPNGSYEEALECIKNAVGIKG